MKKIDLKSLLVDLDEYIKDATDLETYGNIEVSNLQYDSRAVKPNTFFFCIPGYTTDGHVHAQDAVKNGATVLAVQHKLDIDVCQIVFTDTRYALSIAAQNFYEHPSIDLTICAVTGTNGKTTTTYLLDWICKHATSAAARTTRVVTGLIGTVETKIGDKSIVSKYTTPASLDLCRLLAQMKDAGVTHVNMEVSSHAIALDRVAGINFALAAFTNLSQDHLDFHQSMEEYFEAKARLFDSELVDMRVIDIDTEAGCKLHARMQDAGFAAISCGLSKDSVVRAKDVELSLDGCKFTLATKDGDFELNSPLIGEFNVSNLTLAATSAHCLGFSWQAITSALADTPQIPGRLERVSASRPDSHNDVAVFVDYCHTPEAIDAALSALRATCKSKIIIVFGCGGDRDSLKRPLMGRAALNADFAVVTSDNPRSEDPMSIIADILTGIGQESERFEVISDRARAIEFAIRKAKPGDCVLIAGKGHENYQLIGDKVLEFDDREVARTILDAL